MASSPHVTESMLTANLLDRHCHRIPSTLLPSLRASADGPPLFRLCAVVTNTAGQLSNLGEIILLVNFLCTVGPGQVVAAKLDLPEARFVQEGEAELLAGLVFHNGQILANQGR